MEKKKNWKDKQKLNGNSSTLKTKPKKKSEITQIIKNTRISKGDYLNCSQLRHFILKYSKKTVYYNTYKNKIESRTTSKNKDKRKEKAEEKKISNAITDEIATI